MESQISPAGGDARTGHSTFRIPHSAIERAPLIVLSGPSGVGKTTLVDELLRRPGPPLRRAITATTRAPRPGEVDEVHYHFWTREQFKDAMRRGEMLALRFGDIDWARQLITLRGPTTKSRRTRVIPIGFG